MPIKNYLAPEERQKLQQQLTFHKHPDIRERILILLCNDGKTQQKIADFLGCSLRKVAYWFEEIRNYFESRTTSGAAEEINNRLKLIKRSSYGFKNFANFRLRCLMCWHLTII
jgi:transposase